MRKLYWLILPLFFTVACADKRPADILPQEKMREVMWDLLKASEFVDGYVAIRDTAGNKTATAIALNNKIYELHKITKSQFDKSYRYYQDHPAQMKSILDSLGKRNEPKPVTANADSVAKAATDSIQERTNNASVVQKKDSVPAIAAPLTRENLPASVIKQRKLAIDSIKRFRSLRHDQRIEQ